MTRPTGLKSYDKRTRKAVFECSVPGTRGHLRKRKVVKVTGWDNLLQQLRMAHQIIFDDGFNFIALLAVERLCARWRAEGRSKQCRQQAGCNRADAELHFH